MKQLEIINSNFLTYTSDLFTIDILGGVDLLQLERMVCTLRVTYKDYPPVRSTLDLYNDDQSDKLIRTLCDKYELKLLKVSKTVHAFILDLESYKLERLKQPIGFNTDFDMNEDEAKAARSYLKSKNLTKRLQRDFERLGVLGEDENALILFLSMASHKYQKPFSVLCMAKAGIGKSHLLQKLSSCMPKGAYSFHTQLSENALYYFDSHKLDGKVLFVEDLEWTHQMLMPLSTLQTSGRLVKTRAAKNKDGLLHSTTFEVAAKLCLVACCYNEKNYERLSLPFLCLHLNHSSDQDIAIMNYQRRTSAGLIDQTEVTDTTRRLQCAIASLEPIHVVNPYATQIELPKDIPAPRKTLLLLLDFIEVVTFFHQRQRAQLTNKQTGEVYIESTPEDIELAFLLLKNSLLRKVDELSTPARGFYNWLQKFLSEAKSNSFTALDIRKAKSIHPRTLNRYLKELCLFNYIQINGGNKYRGGFIYKVTGLDELSAKQDSVTEALNKTLKVISASPVPAGRQGGTRSVSQKAVSNS